MAVKGPAFLADACHDLVGQIDEALVQLPASPEDVVALVQDILGQPPDLVVRQVATDAHLLFLETTIDLNRVEQALVQPLTQPGAGTFAGRTTDVRTYGDALDALLQAKVLLVRGGEIAVISMDKWPQRDPGEPPAEIVPQGPHQGFVENLQTNIALVRQRIRDPRLRWRRLSVGTRSATPAALIYVQGLARPALLEEVERRLHDVHASFATDTSVLQEWLTPVSGWLFPTMQSTERPDVAAAALLEGRVLFLVDGSPVGILAPTVFAHLIQTPMDYYNRSFDALLKRVIRFGALLAAITASPLFVSLVTTNEELIPSRLFVSIAQARLGVPLPAVAEVFVMEVLVELLREASLRMPGAVGQSISIVGAVVIGQSAVMAGLISAPVVVVVALSYIAGTVVPSLDARVALRAIRFPLIALAAVFGLFGLMWGLMLLLLYLLALESFGVPYLAPVAPHRARGLQDTIRRIPLTDMRRSFLARNAAGPE